ncbi:hypothetical protein Rcae01_01420 [Novipirellula caenicola]|uniref:Uncharacterized protein n=1 Tax=Novipirellula caenicola TaxID=1536901 RepID=A0ABP9VNV5_9BACT
MQAKLDFSVIGCGCPCVLHLRCVPHLRVVPPVYFGASNVNEFRACTRRKPSGCSEQNVRRLPAHTRRAAPL